MSRHHLPWSLNMSLRVVGVNTVNVVHAKSVTMTPRKLGRPPEVIWYQKRLRLERDKKARVDKLSAQQSQATRAKLREDPLSCSLKIHLC